MNNLKEIAPTLFVTIFLSIIFYIASMGMIITSIITGYINYLLLCLFYTPILLFILIINLNKLWN